MAPPLQLRWSLPPPPASLLTPPAPSPPRPVPCLSTMHTHTHLQATMPQADIDAWTAGRPPASTACSGASLLQHQQQQLPSLADAPDRLRTVRLFSLNDYLGLSTHPAVRQAVADAALQCGNGEKGIECAHAQMCYFWAHSRCFGCDP